MSETYQDKIKKHYEDKIKNIKSNVNENEVSVTMKLSEFQMLKERDNIINKYVEVNDTDGLLDFLKLSESSEKENKDESKESDKDDLEKEEEEAKKSLEEADKEIKKSESEKEDMKLNEKSERDRIILQSLDYLTKNKNQGE